MISHLLGASGPVLGDDHVWSLSAQSFGHDHLVITAASKFPDRSRKGIEKRSGKGLQTMISPFSWPRKICHCTFKSFWRATRNCSCNDRVQLSKHTQCQVFFHDRSNLWAIAHNLEKVHQVAMSMGLWTVCTPILHCLRQASGEYTTTTTKKKEIAQHDTQSQAKCWFIAFPKETTYMKRKSNLRKRKCDSLYDIGLVGSISSVSPKLEHPSSIHLLDSKTQSSREITTATFHRIPRPADHSKHLAPFDLNVSFASWLKEGSGEGFPLGTLPTGIKEGTYVVKTISFSHKKTAMAHSTQGNGWSSYWITRFEWYIYIYQ